MDRASQPDCPGCGFSASSDTNYLSRHACPRCGTPLPLRAREDPYLAFGLERRFQLDPSLLEKRFYELSRALHPDRFAALGGEARKNSVERMTFLNDAYNTLKDPEKRRAWLLQMLTPPTPAGGKQQVHSELAMEWFEVQDAAETPGPDAARAIQTFEERLRETRSRSRNALQDLEKSADAALSSGTDPDPKLLEELRKELMAQSTLSSLERDVERLKKRLFIT